MGKPTGFLDYGRKVWENLPVEERTKNYREFHKPFTDEERKEQAARCMDCGIPFCHSHGCPLGNLIPDWNDLLYRNEPKEALELLHLTNNFPEFTGRVCPAPCEKACTLSINDDPVAIELIEYELAEMGWKQGWIKPQPPAFETGKRVAVIGGGPAGLSAAQQLRRAGHEVVVYERDEKVGGLLRFGIPDFKLEKHVIDRRVMQMIGEGVKFETGVNVGVDISIKFLQKRFDALLLACGAKVPRDLPVPGRELGGVHFAMDFLAQNNRRVYGITIPDEELIDAAGKHVVVIGGGDTGSDCVGTSIRQGAKSVTQIELLPKPVVHDDPWNPSWPDWPGILRTSTSHQEGCERMWSIGTKEFIGKDGTVTTLVAEKLDWTTPEDGGRPQMKAIDGSRFELKADLVLLAMGFLHVEPEGLVKDLGVELDGRGNVVAGEYGATSCEGVYAAGDTALGASLVVRAQAQGRKAAIGIDRYLMGDTVLPDTTLI